MAARSDLKLPHFLLIDFRVPRVISPETTDVARLRWKLGIEIDAFAFDVLSIRMTIWVSKGVSPHHRFRTTLTYGGVINT